MANNSFISNRENIRRIMAMDSNGTMDRMVRESVENGSFQFGEDGGTYTPKARQGSMPRAINSNGPINPNSKLPSVIKESFANNPIPDLPYPSGLGGSVLDELGIPPKQALQQPKTTMVEQYSTPMQTTPQMSGIDYSLIKTIVNEAVEEKVKKYVSALSKKLISEGVGGAGNSKTNMVILGDAFSFCDKDGNLYEATLKFKKNIKKKLNE